MRFPTCRAPRFGATGWLVFACWGLATAVTTGCGPSTPLGGAGADLRPPAGWSAVAPDRWAVPGTPVAAWTGPGGASLVAYQALPIPGGTAEEVGKALETRLMNMPELRVLERRTTTVAGLDAARVEVVAPGSGDRLAPTSTGKPLALDGATLSPTRRVVVAVPRVADLFVLLWHAPETEAAQLAKAVETTLATVRLDAGAGAARSY